MFKQVATSREPVRDMRKGKRRPKRQVGKSREMPKETPVPKDSWIVGAMKKNVKKLGNFQKVVTVEREHRLSFNDFKDLDQFSMPSDTIRKSKSLGSSDLSNNYIYSTFIAEGSKEKIRRSKSRNKSKDEESEQKSFKISRVSSNVDDKRRSRASLISEGKRKSILQDSDLEKMVTDVNALEISAILEEQRKRMDKRRSVNLKNMSFVFTLESVDDDKQKERKEETKKQGFSCLTMEEVPLPNVTLEKENIVRSGSVEKEASDSHLESFLLYMTQLREELEEESEEDFIDYGFCCGCEEKQEKSTLLEINHSSDLVPNVEISLGDGKIFLFCEDCFKDLYGDKAYKRANVRRKLRINKVSSKNTSLLLPNSELRQRLSSDVSSNL